jgi:hypothetical protein
MAGGAHAHHGGGVRGDVRGGGVAPALAGRLGALPRGKVWFGPRRPLRRHDARLNVADTVLPVAPHTLLPTRGDTP